MKLKYSLIVLILVALFSSGCKEETEHIYEELDLFELDNFVLKKRSDFEKHFKHIYEEEDGTLPYYGFKTEYGVYYIYTSGVDPTSSSNLIFRIHAMYKLTETNIQGIERLRRIANLHFSRPPDKTYINPKGEYSLGLGDLVEVDDVNEFYDQAIADNIDYIYQIWADENYSYSLSMEQGHVQIIIQPSSID